MVFLLKTEATHFCGNKTFKRSNLFKMKFKSNIKKQSHFGKNNKDNVIECVLLSKEMNSFVILNRTVIYGSSWDKSNWRPTKYWLIILTRENAARRLMLFSSKKTRSISCFFLFFFFVFKKKTTKRLAESMISACSFSDHDCTTKITNGSNVCARSHSNAIVLKIS